MEGKISISENYLESLGPMYKCPKGCGGTMIQVYVRYEQGGEIKKEYECSKCGKVVKGVHVFSKERKWGKNNRFFRKQR